MSLSKITRKKTHQQNYFIMFLLQNSNREDSLYLHIRDKKRSKNRGDKMNDFRRLYLISIIVDTIVMAFFTIASVVFKSWWIVLLGPIFFMYVSDDAED